MDPVKLRKFLEEYDLVIVPRQPTGSMEAAAYYAGSISDHGGSERKDFVEEWNAAVSQWVTGKKPTGLLSLVRPIEWDDDPHWGRLRDWLYPKP